MKSVVTKSSKKVAGKGGKKAKKGFGMKKGGMASKIKSMKGKMC